MDCLGVPEIGLDQWVKDLFAEGRHERLPMLGSLELTHRCNVDCVQCYCNLPADDHQALSRELSYGEICDVIDQAADEGCLWLLLTGGEPLLRSDFSDVYAHVKQRGMLVMLFTNGTLLDEEMVDYLAEWPPRRMEITLHGVTRETFERVTRVSGSYDACMRGIELLSASGVPFSLKTTVTTLNKHELWATKEFAESLGVDYRFDGMLIPRLDGSRQPYSVRLSAEELVELDLADPERSVELQRVCEQFWGVTSSDSLYVCGAGERSFHVDPYGNLALCMTNHAHTYDLRQGSFREAWWDFIPGVRSLKAEHTNKCRACPATSLCGQCPAWSYLEHRDLETPVEYLCRLGHSRAAAFRPGYLKEEQFDETPSWQEAV